MLELLSRPVYLKSRRGAGKKTDATFINTGFLKSKNTKKVIDLAVSCEADHYLVFISRVIVALTARLTQMADALTSDAKVLTSGTAGML